MRRALPRWARHVDTRMVKEEAIGLARERVFGPQGNMPGDRYFRKNLEGRRLMRWYFPSKFNFQDFRVDEYFEMQAERAAPRTVHPCVPAMVACREQVARRREELRSFFQQVDEATFLSNPTLQDLYGLFRLVDPDPALSFRPPPEVFKEHSPMFAKSAPLRLASGGPALEEAELQTLRQLLKKRLPQQEFFLLDSRIAKQQSLEGVQELLLAAARDHGVKMSFDVTAVYESESAPQPAAASRPARRAERPPAPVEEAAAGAAAAGQAEEADELADPHEDVRHEAQGFHEDAREEVRQQVEVAHEETSGRVVRRQRMALHLVKSGIGGSSAAQQSEMQKAEKELETLRKEGARPVREYLARRHRFIDPMFRRRRLKWLERQMDSKHKEREIKFNSYYTVHPDNHKEWPTNKGSVTVVWPSPYH